MVLCDLHVHFRDLGEDDKEDFDSGARSASFRRFYNGLYNAEYLPP